MQWFEIALDQNGSSIIRFKGKRWERESFLSYSIQQGGPPCQTPPVFTDKSLRQRIANMRIRGKDTSFEEEALVALMADVAEFESVMGVSQGLLCEQNP